MADTPTTSPENEAMKTAVIEACREGNLQAVQDHLQKGGDIDELLITKKGGECSLLMMASQCGHETIVDYLLKVMGANPNVQDNGGVSALMLAGQNGHSNVIKLLHEFSAQVDLRKNDGMSALMLASHKGHSEVVKLLHEFGAQVDMLNNNGWSALMLASHNGHSEVVNNLYKLGAQVDLLNNNGLSALMLASKNGHSEVVNLLQKFCAQVDLQEENGWSALMIASTSGHSEVVQQLLENGAQLDILEKHGGSALMLASSYGQSNIVKLLHKFGAQVDLQNDDGLSALMIASANGHSEVVKLLIKLGAQVDLQEENGWSALMIASQNGDTEVVKLLHEFGAQVDLQEKNGWSALMTASLNGHSEVIKLLHEFGAQVDLQNNDGWSALMLASQNGHSEIVKLLLEFGAQLDLQNKNGSSALTIAIRKKYFEIVKLLQQGGAKHDPKLPIVYKSGLLPVTSSHRVTELFSFEEEPLYAYMAQTKLPTVATASTLSKNVKSFRALADIDSQYSDHDQYSAHDQRKIQVSLLKKGARPPVITSQPEGQALDHYGGEVTLSITTQYCDKFEWFKDGERIAPDVHPHCDNYDTPNLVISPFMPEYEGRYKCRVSNEAGCMESIDTELSIAFDREVLLCCQNIDQDGGKIKCAGIELYFPNDALLPGETSNIKVFASTDGPTEHSGLFSVSPIFHVKCEPYREFQKEVQVTIEHFTKLEVEDDIDNLVFMVSKRGGEFHPAAGRVMTEVGSRYGTVEVKHFCWFGLFWPWKKRERKCPYLMLVALPKNPCTLEGFVWAFFSITVNSSTYTKIFETYLQRFKDHPFEKPIEQRPIELLDEVDLVELTLPSESEVKPYAINPSFKPATIEKKHVISKSKKGDVYPPRIRLNIALTDKPRTPLSCDIQLSGIKKPKSFALRAVVSKETPTEHNTRSRAASRNESHEISQAEDVEIDDVKCDSSHHATLYQQLQRHAAKWRDIGTHLGFHKDELDNIQTKPLLLYEAPSSWLREMLSEWLEWAPGDGRGSVRRATLNQLKVAVRKSGLENTAKQLHCIASCKESSV